MSQPRRRKRDADPLVDHQRDRAGDREHGEAVHADRRERDRQRARAKLAAPATRQGTCGSTTGISISPAPCALAIRNDHAAEPGEAHRHAEAHPMARAVERVVDGPADQQHARGTAQQASGRPRGRAAARPPTTAAIESTWPNAIGASAPDHHRAAAAMQAERHREQPAHRRVDAMERAEPGEHNPGPGPAHRRGLRLSAPARPARSCMGRFLPCLAHCCTGAPPSLQGAATTGRCASPLAATAPRTNLTTPGPACKKLRS